MSAECSTENIPLGYKKTDVRVIPEDWSDPKLEDIVKQDSPICYGIVQVGSYTPNGIPVIAIKNLNSDYSTNIHLASVEVERPYQRSRIFSEDVLISVKGTTGRIGIVPFGFYGNISRDLARLRLREGIVPKFVFQMLQSNLMQRHLEVAVVGTTRMELSIAILKKVRIPLPPTKAEQKAIVEALSNADAFIKSLEQLIAKKRQIKQGAMQELLTGTERLPGFEIKRGYKQTEVGVIPEDWEVLTLGNVIEYVKGFAFNALDYQQYGVRIIRVSDTTYDGIKEGEGIYIDEIKAKNFRKWSLREGDLIVSTVGSKPPMYDSMVGKVTFVQSKDSGSLLNQNAVILRSKKWSKELQCLLHNHLKQKRYLTYIEKIFRGNANQASITLKELFEYPIPFPPTTEEKETIATILSDMDSEIIALEEKLAKARQIKQGMMQELLTGRIRLNG